MSVLLLLCYKGIEVNELVNIMPRIAGKNNQIFNWDWRPAQLSMLCCASHWKEKTSPCLLEYWWLPLHCFMPLTPSIPPSLCLSQGLFIAVSCCVGLLWRSEKPFHVLCNYHLLQGVAVAASVALVLYSSFTLLFTTLSCRHWTTLLVMSDFKGLRTLKTYEIGSEEQFNKQWPV